MSGTGIVLKDLLPTPERTDAVAETGEGTRAMGQEATASHVLALSRPEDKGAAQVDRDGEVADLGWSAPAGKIPDPLVAGIPNEDLWLLIRRFNKQLYHVKQYPHPPPGNLDLNIADEDEFSPDKLRATLERLYMTVIIGLMGFGKHVVRLRSWNESRRTACFAAAYFTAWVFDFLVPLYFTTLIALIAYPPSREFLFPPAPLALVDGKTGGVQKPKAGVLGSHDSATGAPENHKGEAVEAEASNFVNGIASVALSSAAGKHPQNEPPSEEGSAHDSVPDPTSMALTVSKARDKSQSGAADPAHDKTRVPMETAMWNKMRPIMHTIGDVADGWERFANVLSPKPPFPRDPPRMRLAGILVPILGIAIFLSSYVFVKSITLGFGIGFFGDPLIWRGLDWLNQNYPNWKKVIELRNTVLKGIPTNAQLTITLLRIGEANKAPLPPPPRSRAPPPDKPAELTHEHVKSTGADAPLNASEDEIRAAIGPDPGVAHETKGEDIEASKSQKHGRKGSRILNMFKHTAKGTIETALGADKLKAKIGSEHAKQRLGVVSKDEEDMTSGPIEFRCRYHGKKGWAYIPTTSTSPCISYSTESSIEKTGTRDREDLHPIWSVAAADIKELKKIGGLGWKAKLVVAWALDVEVADGLEIVDRRGNTWVLTACPLRDELFNRLIAIGGQKWESW